MDALIKKAYQQLNEVGYHETSFLDGYTPDDIETVLPVLQRIVEGLGMKGRLQVLWSLYDDFGFGGDSDWVLYVEGKVYTVSVILQEQNDLVDLLNEMDAIKNDKMPSVDLTLSEDTPFNYDWNAIEGCYGCTQE
ncbi:hypothetical protein CN918_30095 [Priestia megaterium]|nr:hypothetical protein CN918_30095 [Priestia megaterium]